MASLARQFVGLKCPPISTKKLVNRINHQSKQQIQKARIAAQASAAVVTNAQTRERLKLKEIFEDAYERCRTTPMEGVAFTVDDFHSALEKYDFDSEVGTKVEFLLFSFSTNFLLIECCFFPQIVK